MLKDFYVKSDQKQEEDEENNKKKKTSRECHNQRP